MARHTISGADWERVRGFLPSRGPKADNRRFVNAVLWVAKTGLPWRDLPGRFGRWNSVWRRFRRWAGAGVWGRVLAAVRNPDVSTLILDSTVVRAHPHAAGAQKKTRPANVTGSEGVAGIGFGETQEGSPCPRRRSRPSRPSPAT